MAHSSAPASTTGPSGDMNEAGSRARRAARLVSTLSSDAKTEALTAMAAQLEAETAAILEANSADVGESEAAGISAALLDRLTLTEQRIEAMANGLRKVAGLADPVGAVTGGWRMHNGIRLQRVRQALGVVAVIYEARPNVTADAAGLCLKSGNAALLRGSSSALNSNLAIGRALRAALAMSGLPEDAVQVLNDTTREGALALMKADRWVDLLVPRGGPRLIASIEEHATVPVVIDGAGNCHVYVDRDADLARAFDVVLNAKTSRPAVCNSAESLVVHGDIAAEFLPKVADGLMAAGVELRGDQRARDLVGTMAVAGDDDWGTEYLDLIMSVRVVDDLDAAIDHVVEYSTGHTEAIITEDQAAATRFIAGVDSAVVMVNASTRFTDGEEFGFGAEIGNSTQKLHARGPMGPEALTSERYVLYGDGHVRG